MRFLDANIFLRHLTGDDPLKAAACLTLFERLRRGEEQETTLEAIIAEVVYVLASPRSGYHLSPAEIRARLVPLLRLKGLRLAHKRVYLRALDLYVAHPSLDFEDVLSVAHMERLGINEILSYDEDFDKVPGIRRTEP